MYIHCVYFITNLSYQNLKTQLDAKRKFSSETVDKIVKSLQNISLITPSNFYGTGNTSDIFQ